MRSHRLRGCYQIAVIGGNGFIGRALISRLSVYPNLRIFSIDKRHNNVWLDLSKSKAIIQQIHMDVSAPGSIQTWLSGGHVDVIVYAAGYESPPIGVWDSSLSEIESIEGLNYALRGLSKLDLDKSEERPYFMYLSSWTVYGGEQKQEYLETDKEFPSNHVGMSKLLGEDLVKRLCTKYNCPWSIVRPTEVFGKRHNNELGKKSYWAGYLPYLVDSVLCKNKEIKVWNSNYSLDLIHVNYVSKVLLHFIQNKIEGIYNIASGSNISLQSILNSIIQISDTQEEVKLLPANLDIDPMCISSNKVHALVPYEKEKYTLDSFLKSYIPVRRYELAKNLAIEDIFLEPLTLDTTTIGAKEAYEARKERRKLAYSKIKEIAGPEFFKLNIGTIQERSAKLLGEPITQLEIEKGSEAQKVLEDLQALVKEDESAEFLFNTAGNVVKKKKRKTKKSAKSNKK